MLIEGYKSYSKKQKSHLIMFLKKFQRLTASRLAVSLWLLSRMFFVEFYCLNRCLTLRSITFTKDIFFHSLTLTLCETHFLFWIWGNVFFGTPGRKVAFYIFLQPNLCRIQKQQNMHSRIIIGRFINKIVVWYHLMTQLNFM